MAKTDWNHILLILFWLIILGEQYGGPSCIAVSVVYFFALEIQSKYWTFTRNIPRNVCFKLEFQSFLPTPDLKIQYGRLANKTWFYWPVLWVSLRVL